MIGALWSTQPGTFLTLWCYKPSQWCKLHIWLQRKVTGNYSKFSYKARKSSFQTLFASTAYSWQALSWAHGIIKHSIVKLAGPTCWTKIFTFS